MEKRKILFVSNTAWNLYNFRRPLLEFFRQQGHEVICAARSDESVERLTEELGVSFYPVYVTQKGKNPLQDLYTCFLLYNLYKKLSPDLVLHFTVKPNIYGSLAARLTKTKVVNNVTGLGTVFLHNTLSTWVAKQLYKFSFKTVEEVVFQNRDDLALFRNRAYIKENQGQVVPGSGVDTKTIQPKFKERSDKMVLLFIGRLLFDKGIVELIQCARMAQARGKFWQFKIVGKGEQAAGLGLSEADFLDRIADLPEVEYIGFCDNIYPLIYKSDLVVLPSYREGFPKSLLEAAATGKVLAATDVPGCREIVLDAENGLLFPPRNAPAMFKAIEAIEKLPPAQYLEFQKKSRALAENSDFSEIQRRYKEIVTKVIAL